MGEVGPSLTPVGLFAGAYFAHYLSFSFQVTGKLERVWIVSISTTVRTAKSTTRI